MQYEAIGIWVELCATPRGHTTEKDTLIWEGVIIDATARKRAEQKLIESQETLRAVTVHHEAEIEEERERFARELHDESGSLLTALKISIANLAGKRGSEEEAAADVVIVHGPSIPRRNRAFNLPVRPTSSR